ncbi:MAG: YggS family pyridoxal phosphate-dependent enzyme [Actinomycetota bacterium]|nr:YggS family pyridoxal phosphate-dependent enzyme [Actinomycetota bacterium]
MTGATIDENLAHVRRRIAVAAGQAGRRAESVTLVAVSKTVPPSAIDEAVAAGQRDFGENRAQELVAHAAAVPDETLRWHFVGRLQSNKVKAIAPIVSCWQSVDRPELGPVIARYAPGAEVLVQVNVGAEPQKGGCPPAETPALVDQLREHGLLVRGLMTVPPVGEDPRPHFEAIRTLGERLGLAELSMGMTGDYEVAIAAGATIVRVGTAVFGARPSLTGPPL